MVKSSLKANTDSRNMRPLYRLNCDIFFHRLAFLTQFIEGGLGDRCTSFREKDEAMNRNNFGFSCFGVPVFTLSSLIGSNVETNGTCNILEV